MTLKITKTNIVYILIVLGAILTIGLSGVQQVRERDTKIAIASLAFQTCQYERERSQDDLRWEHSLLKADQGYERVLKPGPERTRLRERIKAFKRLERDISHSRSASCTVLAKAVPLPIATK